MAVCNGLSFLGDERTLSNLLKLMTTLHPWALRDSSQSRLWRGRRNGKVWDAACGAGNAIMICWRWDDGWIRVMRGQTR